MKILQVRKIPRNKLLDKEKSQGNDRKLIFNVTYYPVFRYLKGQLKELHAIVACDEDLKKYFLKYQWLVFLGFKNNNKSKSHLVRANINEIGRCKPCSGKTPLC